MGKRVKVRLHVMETVSLGQSLVNRTLHMLSYSRKLSREKTFAVLWLFVKVFSACGILWCGKSEQSTKLTDTQPNKVEKEEDRGLGEGEGGRNEVDILAHSCPPNRTNPDTASPVWTFTHQQYPVELWHCTEEKLPSLLH